MGSGAHSWYESVNTTQLVSSTGTISKRQRPHPPPSSFSFSFSPYHALLLGATVGGIIQKRTCSSHPDKTIRNKFCANGFLFLLQPYLSKPAHAQSRISQVGGQSWIWYVFHFGGMYVILCLRPATSHNFSKIQDSVGRQGVPQLPQYVPV